MQIQSEDKPRLERSSRRNKSSADKMDSWDDDSERRTFIRWVYVALRFVVGLAALAGIAFLGVQIREPQRTRESPAAQDGQAPAATASGTNSAADSRANSTAADRAADD